MSFPTVEELAELKAGNWKKFDNFIWTGEDKFPQAEQWAIINLSNRDAGLMQQSNYKYYVKELKPFKHHVVFQEHGHFACGTVYCMVIRVYNGKGKITEAFQKFHEIEVKKDAYYLLDENDHSEMEWEATMNNIGQIIRQVNYKKELPIPDDAATQVYRWLNDNDHEDELCEVDDGGAWPNEEFVAEAMEALFPKNSELAEVY